ncbi:YihY/virulence factor BrkB family protein [Microbacterium sp.]|uniref:YihY/virulence factor BrkB family protein n=1 Tax=Microbacterium sp. TaxID=51671 RepID=UPI003A92A6F2
MTPPTRAENAAGSHAAAEQARAHEEHLKERFEQTESELRERFAVPIERATRLTRRTLALFPVRVWRRFLQHNGFLLAAGVSYQALFAFFAAIYVAFTVVGLWLGSDQDAIDWLIDLINQYVPGLISTDSADGVIQPDQLSQIASASAGTLTITGLIAAGTLAWTAIGWVTFSRRAVRDILGLPLDARGYVLLKARDFVAALAFGLAMIAGGLLNNIGTYALTFTFDLLHISTNSGWFLAAVRVLTVLISLLLNTAALAGLFRFLAGVGLKGKRVRPGALLGGIGVTVLQLGVGLLVIYTPANPLLATFAIFIGLLLWFRLIGIVTLVAAAWIAVAAADDDIPLEQLSEQERLRAEHEELLHAARERLRTAQAERDAVPWFRRLSANRAVREAESELLQVETAAPPPSPVRARPKRVSGAR